MSSEPWHGTANGYGNHGCRCEPCTEAHSAYCYKRALVRKSKPTPDHVHGTANGYGNYGCRCADCTEAWTLAARAIRSRRARVS